MKPFRFRLDPVLRLRRQRLEQARVDLARSLQRELDQRETLARSTAEVGRSNERLQASVEGGAKGGELGVFAASTARQIERVAREALAVETARGESASQRALATEAHAKVKALETLRERREAGHRRCTRQIEERRRLENLMVTWPQREVAR